MIPQKKSFLARSILARTDGWVILGVAALILAFMFNGCGEGLPKNLKKEAKAIPDIIKTTQSQVDDLENKYQSLAKSAPFKPIAPFATKENWTQKFIQATNELKRTKDLYDTDLKPLIKKNKPELAPQVKQQLQRIQKLINGAKDIARYPLTRFTKIKETINTAGQVKAQSQKNTDQITQIAAALQAGALAKALTDFPDITDKINARFAPLSKLEQQSQDHLKTIAIEFTHHTSGSQADYAAFTDSSQAIMADLTQATIIKTTLTKELGQLYSSYTKILKDMKEEYVVTIKRESWNENSDYYDPRFATFQRQVNADLYEALTADNIDAIAAIKSGFRGSNFSSNIGNMWKELKINPTENWPGRGHNAASFWVEDSKEAYFHKYLLEEKGETKETNWEPVEASFFDANLEFLGMAILAKPYGVFEKDRIIQATPPGMAYVGNAKYGEWKKDSSGSSFWSWYGKYAMFSMLFNSRPSYYGYNSWNGWNNNYRNNRPYYGKTQSGFQKYGTSGTTVKKSPKFQSSTFAKSGGFKSQTASVRGAGANLRGGGPKSKGK